MRIPNALSLMASSSSRDPVRPSHSRLPQPGWLLCLLLVINLLTSPSQAADPELIPVPPPPPYQAYGWVEFGGAVLSDLDGRLRSPSIPDTDVELSLSPGFAVAGGFGERLSSSLIAEIQGGLFYHNIDEIVAVGTPGWSIDASLFQVPIMLNLVFELPLRYRLKPFVGAGAGAVISWLDIDDSLPAHEGLPGPQVDRTSTEVNFAYQGFAGLRLSLARQGVLTFSYRALAGGNPQWSLKEKSTGQTVGNLKAEDVLVHSFTLGFMVPF
jgi:opacity protein-like surface antigen